MFLDIGEKMKITVVGAGFYGSTTVQRIAEANYAQEVVMVDILEGKPQGLALDMNQAQSIEGFNTNVIGTNSYDETADSDICVITAGLPRKPGMSRMDLLEVSAGIVSGVTKSLAQASPNAVLIIVSNPLDEMTALASLVSGFDKNKVMGQAGMLDTARFKYFVAQKCGVNANKVEAMTLGSHGDTMVPVPSLVKVDGKPLADVLNAEEVEELVERTRAGGAEIVGLLKTGSAYYAPSAAAAKMVQAVAQDTKEQMPVCAFMDGEYGINDVYLGVPAIIGRGGVEKVVELDLSSEEKSNLIDAAKAVGDKQADVKAFV